MGQAMRIMKYNRTTNERNALSALQWSESVPLQWFRLDDGVMGGQSETIHSAISSGLLHFTGTINTNGGGFASIRSKIPEGSLSNSSGVKLRLRGDGKTYKFILTTSSGGGPFSPKPSWQYDIPTTQSTSDDEWQEVMIPFDRLLPSFGGRGTLSPEQQEQYTFDGSEMNEIGLMLSLKLANGSANPPATFGEGVFPFSLMVQLMEPLESKPGKTLN